MLWHEEKQLNLYFYSFDRVEFDNQNRSQVSISRRFKLQTKQLKVCIFFSNNRS